MQELITKLQGALNASNEFTEEEKDLYYFRLESLKYLKNEKMRPALEAWAKSAAEEPRLIKEFFKGMDDFLGTFIMEGDEAAAKKLQQARDSLKKDS